MSITIGGSTYNVYSPEQIDNKKTKLEQILSQLKLREVGSNVYTSYSNNGVFYVWNPVTEEMEELPPGDIRADGSYTNGSLVNNGTLQAYKQGYNFTDKEGVYEKDGKLYTWDTNAKQFKEIVDEPQDNNDDCDEDGLSKVLDARKETAESAGTRGSDNAGTVGEGDENKNSDFGSYEDLRSYIFSGCVQDLYSKYHITVNNGNTLDAVASKHEKDWENITKNEIIDEIYQEYLDNDFKTDTFKSFEDLYNYVLGTAYTDYINTYDDGLFSGGTEAGKIVAEWHRNNYKQVTKAQVLEELNNLFVQRKNSRDTMNEIGFFGSYEELSKYLFNDAEYDFNRIYKDIKYAGGSQAAQIVSEYYKDSWSVTTKSEILDDLHAQMLKLNQGKITEYKSMWGQPEYLLAYLLKDAKIDFETKYPDMKFVSGSQAALNVYSKHRSYGDNYTREQILEELYNEFKTCGNNTADYSEDNELMLKICHWVDNKNRTFESYNSMLSAVIKEGERALNNAGISNFAKWGDCNSFLRKLCEMHKQNYNNVTFKDLIADALRMYYQGFSDEADIEKFANINEIEKDASRYYEKMLDELLKNFKNAETATDFRDILRQLSLMPLNFSSENNQSFDDYALQYSELYGIPKDAIESLYNNTGNKSLFQKATYILAQCKATLYNINKDGNEAVNLEEFQVSVDEKGNISFENDLAFLNNKNNNDLAQDYIKTICDIVESRLYKLLPLQGQAGGKIDEEIENLVNLLRTLSSKLENENDNISYLLSVGDENTINNAAPEVLINYIDKHFKDVIGNKSEFMKLVTSYYEGAKNYDYEDCAALLTYVLTSSSNGKIPNKETVAETLAQLLEMQDIEYENHKQIYETVENTITSYLDNNENISISDFLEYCKSNNVYETFRTEAEITKDIESTLDKLNDLLRQQRDLVNKYGGYNPPNGTSDAKLMEDLQKQTEQLQYQLNKFSAETPREKAEETLKEYFINIMSELCNTGLSKEDVQNLLNNGTDLSNIYIEETQRAMTRGASFARATGQKIATIGEKIHSILGKIGDALGVTKQVTSTVGLNNIADLSDKWSDYAGNGSDLFNAYKDPKDACNTIVQWAGISTNFVSAIFAFGKGEYEEGMQQSMIGFGYTLSPSIGGGIQNFVDLVTALNEYNKSESDYAKDWEGLFPEKDIYQIAKMKLTFDISMGVLGLVGNILTGGIFGAVQGGLKVVEQLFKTSIGGILKQVDKIAEKLGIKLNLSAIGEKLKNLDGKFWNKTWVGQFLKSLFYNLFKSDSENNGADVKVDVDKLMKTLNGLNVLMNVNDNQEGFQKDANGNKVKFLHTEIDGKKEETGKVIILPNGDKEYYEKNANGEWELVASQQGELVTYTDGSTQVLDSDIPSETPVKSNEKLEEVLNNFGNGAYGTGANFEPNRMIIDWIKAGGKAFTFKGNSAQDAYNDFYNAYKNGTVGDFIKAVKSGSYGGASSTSSTGSSGGAGSSGGPQNGGYCPDGTYSPIADGSGFWGGMGGVIGVGGHGGTPVLGGGGGGNNSYQY